MGAAAAANDTGTLSAARCGEELSKLALGQRARHPRQTIVTAAAAVRSRLLGDLHQPILCSSVAVEVEHARRLIAIKV
ncbi:MAG: hypothetical protein ACPIOQ_60980, partial [Promethearchaeia archaeon]